MNFFGHATIARLHDPTPRFVLGAMLPDLWSMAAVRVAELNHPELTRGVAHHHETDRRFHAAPAFRALCASALTALEAAGVARAPARAVGHVGSELLLDGLLGEDPGARAAYGAALGVARTEDVAGSLSYKEPRDAMRMRGLFERLAQAPLPGAYREPEGVCDRLYVILSRRPRLALAATDRDAVLDFLRFAQGELRRDAAELVEALR